MAFKAAVYARINSLRDAVNVSWKIFRVQYFRIGKCDILLFL